jgi:hypothetical protein
MFPIAMKTQTCKILSTLSIVLLVLNSCHQRTVDSIKLGQVSISPENISFRDSANSIINPGSLGIMVNCSVDTISSGIYKLKVSVTTNGSHHLRDIEIPLEFTPEDHADREDVRTTFHWVPNLKKKPEEIIAQHVFRSPAIILSSKQSRISVIPDLEAIKLYPETPYYLDLNFGNKRTVISYGLSNYKTDQHVYYERKDSSFLLPKKTELGLYIICSDHSSSLDILKKTNSFMWNTFAAEYLDSLLPQAVPFNQYASAGYTMALSKYWVNGPKPETGGITLSTFLDKTTGIYRGRDFKDDLWFHSWFNNARTAYGLYLWGEETGNVIWKNKAIATMNLLLSSPQRNGFFPTIWVPEKNGWVSSGQGGGPDLYHVPDNCWTAIWLLRFNDELIKIPGTDNFLVDFVRGLLTTQLENGSFPARLHVSDLSPDPVLENSASGSMATWFLEEMILRKKLSPDLEEKANTAVKKSLSFLEKEILPNRRFQDFEVFFSCAPNSINDFDSLTWLYPHNTLSIQWTAEAFLKGYSLFNDNHNLAQGEYCLNILSLYQQVWSPPFIGFYSFGGFGVQNTDAEWSDARQAQFAETYLNFFLATGNREYLQRSIAACRASFALMAIPENKKISPHNYEGSTFNGEFTGAMAENYGHSGYNERSGQSGFHWGTGSALTTAAIFRSRLGDIYLDEDSKLATGIDGVIVRKTDWGDTIKLTTSRLLNLKPLRIYCDQDDVIGKKVILDNDKTPVLVSTCRKTSIYP